MSLVSIEQVRAQLRIDPGDDDLLVGGMIAAAERAVEINTGRTIADGPDAFGEKDKPVAAQAVLLLLSTWYDERDTSSPASVAELPLAVSWLLWPLKRLTV